jgi:phosphomannomutase
MPRLTCFKAYDVRGRLGVELDDDIAWRIGRAFAEVRKAGRVVVGRDCRASSETLAAALTRGLRDGGAEVLDIGLAGTEEVYFATAHLGADGGIEVTASHNPIDYNGMKLVGLGARPLDPETELAAVKALAETGNFAAARRGGLTPCPELRRAYVQKVLSFVDVAALKPLTILVNAGNGTAGPSFDAIAEALEARGAPLRFVRMHHAPDGSFPNGIPNPLLPENQPATARAVRASAADFGVAWDGDFDRCFFFDAEGAFVAGEYVVGLLAQIFLLKTPGAGIVHDPRVVLGTRSIVAAAGARAIESRTGHAYLKQSMRESGAIYGGEMSAHHYFRDFMCCDSGMIPWLLIAELVSRSGRSLAELLAAMRSDFPSSGEINFRVDDTAEVIARVRAAFAPLHPTADENDGLSLAFPNWRLNLRASNTEPLLRLNVESRGDASLLAARVAELAALIGGTRI